MEWTGTTLLLLYICLLLFVCLFTQTFYAYVRSLTELADPRQNVFCSSVTALRTKIWSKYNCCKRFMTWQLIIRHLLLTCITSYTHTHTHTHTHTTCLCVSCSLFRIIQLFPVRHSALFNCLPKTRDKFTAVPVWSQQLYPDWVIAI